MKDFVSEVPMFLRGHDVVSIVSDSLESRSSVEENLRRAYDALTIEGIVSKEEIDTLDCWLEDLKNLQTDAP